MATLWLEIKVTQVSGLQKKTVNVSIIFRSKCWKNKNTENNKVALTTAGF